MRALTIIVRVIMTIALLGTGYVIFDTMRAKRTKKSPTAPFGDQHYETVKTALPDNAFDADTPAMQKARRDLIT